MNPASVLLNGRVAVVTGGGAGIGRAIAEAFVSFGARVAIFERDPERAARVAGELVAKGGEVVGLEVDVRDREAVDRAVALSADHFGAIDILVNNVGGVFAAPFLETHEKGWDALHRAKLTVPLGRRWASPTISAEWRSSWHPTCHATHHRRDPARRRGHARLRRLVIITRATDATSRAPYPGTTEPEFLWLHRTGGMQPRIAPSVVPV